MNEKVTNLSEYRTKLPSMGPPPLKGGGGDGTSGDMDARVAVLEAGFKRIETTLDRLDVKLSKISDDTSGIKESLKSVASAEKVGEISGALKDKPSTWQMVLICVLISGLTVAAALGGVAKLLPK